MRVTSFFESIEIRDRAKCHYCMGWRQDVPIAIARGLRRPLESIWPELRRYGYSARKLYLLQQAGILAEPASRSIE